MKADTSEGHEPFITRKYSVYEIDTMRKQVRRLNNWHPFSKPHRADDQIERELRTYMMAGVDPSELEQMAIAHVEKRKKAEEARRSAPAEIDARRSTRIPVDPHVAP